VSHEGMTRPGSNRPWVMLVMDFAGSTTMHGVRFLAEPTKFLIRRFSDLTVAISLHKEHWFLQRT